MYIAIEMDSQFKSMATVNPDAWVEHFKRSIGKPFMWGSEPKLVLLKNKTGNATATASSHKEMPLNVVSPVEQYANMAKADADKGVPKYTNPSVPSVKSGGEGKKKKRSRKRKKHSKSGKSSKSKGKRRKKQGDIFK